MNDNKYLLALVNSLPSLPGIYQFYDRDKQIIYIGKAKDLKKRVSSYFNKIHDSNKTNILVRNIASLNTIIVETEQDALILENNLIKKYRPRYNILLKDDKTFPWICIKKERFPRVFQTRNVVRDGSSYYGPYTSGLMVKTLIEFFKHTYKIRTCNFLLTTDNVSRGKFKVCLQYHIGNCLGPCENLQDENNYTKSIEDIIAILKGNIGEVIVNLEHEMKTQAADLMFEEAQKIKEKIDSLQKFQAKSQVVSQSIRNIDVYSYRKEDKDAYINFLKVINGCVIQSYTLEIKLKVEETDSDLLLMGITEIRSNFYSNASEVLVPFKLDYEIPGVKFVIPKIGEKKLLLELSDKNLKYYILEKKKSQSILKNESPVVRILSTAQKDLRLISLPTHIECFDNSNLQGSNPVASCVVFRNAKPSKKEYRHFNIKTVEGPNDFASMEEIVTRRYKRMLDEEGVLPNLIIIDGGKGQVSAAVLALEKLGIDLSVSIIGIAKRLEEIFFPHDPVPLYIDKTSETLRLIQKMRDEAHRFAITHHREKRTKSMISSELDTIKGIGEKTKKLLLTHFKSVEHIKKSSSSDLEKIVGQSKTKVLIDYFYSTDQKL
jgi:excinuclease ABC subunit C